MAQLGGAAGRDATFFDLDLRKAGFGESNHHARHALVAHQHVGAAAQQPHGQFFLQAADDQASQLVDVRRLGEVFRRSA